MSTSVNDLAQVIQIVVAPIFMLTGIAGFLNVMSGRLGRIVDRARIMERRVRRIKLINRSIGLCTASALFVCSVVVLLFLGDLLLFDLSQLIVTMFVIALFLLIFALLTFLKEVQLATRTLQMGKEKIFDQ